MRKTLFNEIINVLNQMDSIIIFNANSWSIHEYNIENKYQLIFRKMLTSDNNYGNVVDFIEIIDYSKNNIQVTFMKELRNNNIEWSIPYIYLNKNEWGGAGFICESIDEFWNEVIKEVNPIPLLNFLETDEDKFLNALLNYRLDLI